MIGLYRRLTAGLVCCLSILLTGCGHVIDVAPGGRYVATSIKDKAFVIDTQTGAHHQVNVDSMVNPTWSPDAGSVAFSSKDSSWVYNRSTGKARKIADGQSALLGWKSDSSAIFIVTSKDTDDSRLVTLDAKTLDPISATSLTLPNGVRIEPLLSMHCRFWHLPELDAVVFLGQNSAGAKPLETGNVWLAENGFLTPLTTGGDVMDVAPSQDNHALWISRGGKPDGVVALDRFDLSNRSSRRILTMPGSTWPRLPGGSANRVFASPDRAGQNLLVVAMREIQESRSKKSKTQTSMVLYNTANRRSRSLFSAPISGEDCVALPRWSLDGQFIGTVSATNHLEETAAISVGSGARRVLESHKPRAQ